MLREGLRRLTVLLRIGAVCWVVGMGTATVANAPTKFVEGTGTQAASAADLLRAAAADTYKSPEEVKDYKALLKPIALAIVLAPGIIGFAIAWLIDGFAGNYRRQKPID